MPPTPRIRPYKDFLTPALHRRFALATATLFGICYAEAVLIGNWNSFIWSWVPFGRAGIRTGLLFIPAFMIFILRVAQLHVGIRTSYSAYQTFTKYAPRFETIQTLTWYLFSAWLFSEVYIWSAPKSADLDRIKISPKTDKPSLNEKPIYLTCFLYFLAIVQSGIHLYYDYDRIDIPVTKTKLEASSDQRSHLIVPPAVQFKTRLPSLASSSLLRVIVMAVASPFIYTFTIREYAWGFTRFFAKLVWKLPKAGTLPEIKPFHMSTLLRTLTSGFLLTVLWEVSNALFTIYVAQEPLKNERPITYESKDPNGSLLTGLKGKKLQTRVFAFWELVYISQRFEGRRRNIFEDIDRKGGSTWSQILAVCLEVITGMDSRIVDYQDPKAAAAKLAKQEEPVPSLPKISKPLKEGLNSPGDIFNTPPPPNSRGVSVVQAVGTFAKNHGQSPSGSSPKARNLLKQAEDMILTPKQKEEVAAQGLNALFKDWATWFLRTNLGWPFRQEYRRRVRTVVLGSPYGDVGIIVDAVDSLTRFAVKSLKEDKYGNVQRDVKLIIRTFTTTVTKVEKFKNTLDVHWTDVEKKRESPEVDTILAALKGGLNELINAFGDYSEDLRLSQSEMRMAREAARSEEVV